MKKEWNIPSLEVLDVNLTMGQGQGQGQGRGCGHRKHKNGPKQECNTPWEPPDDGIGES